MKTITGKALCKLLEQHQWELKRVNSSHHIYCKAGSVVRLSVPVHGSKDLKIGLLKSILKTAGLSENDI